MASSGSERHSEDGSDIPPDMTDDDGHDEDGGDMVGSDIEHFDEDISIDEELEPDCDVGALLASAMPEPMGLACDRSLPMNAGAESMDA